MPILNFNNKLISRDEGLHTDFGYLMFRHLVDKSSQDKFYEIVKDTVSIQCEFLTANKALPLICVLIRINVLELNIGAVRKREYCQATVTGIGDWGLVLESCPQSQEITV